MRATEPHVRLIAQSVVDWTAMAHYLYDIGGEVWYQRMRDDLTMTNDATVLVEFAGRLCYRSWAPGLNANVNKVREDSAEYLHNILASGHGSVLEHASFTFIFQDVSRVFTHELVRHRAGVAISQESLRYVRLTDLGFRVPPQLQRAEKTVVSMVETLEQLQRELADVFDLDAAGVPFHVKKEVTSALRRLAPLGLSTSMVWTANVRTLRHVLEARTSPGAEEEIRLVFDQVGEILLAQCPMLFDDFARDEEGTWTTPYSKV